ncbi:hypothetical protein BRD11_03950 [Halobacteriales archaeon SW_12_69_24]|nr:MAG: hypothetical protein BRD11_03950 [Halobacteriales archaeon SW_12_69_24]
MSVSILADENVPDEYVSALRGDGHEVVYSREVPELGSQAEDEELVGYADAESFAILSTDIKDFSERSTDVAVFVAPQDMTGGEVRAAVDRLETLPFDPAASDPIWLSGF